MQQQTSSIFSHSNGRAVAVAMVMVLPCIYVCMYIHKTHAACRQAPNPQAFFCISQQKGRPDPDTAPHPEPLHPKAMRPVRPTLQLFTQWTSWSCPAARCVGPDWPRGFRPVWEPGAVLSNFLEGFLRHPFAKSELVTHKSCNLC